MFFVMVFPDKFFLKCGCHFRMVLTTIKCNRKVLTYFPSFHYQSFFFLDRRYQRHLTFWLNTIPSFLQFFLNLIELKLCTVKNEGISGIHQTTVLCKLNPLNLKVFKKQWCFLNNVRGYTSHYCCQTLQSKLILIGNNVII